MDWDKVDEAFTGQPITTAEIAALFVLGFGVLLSWMLGRTLRRAVGRPGGHYQQMEKPAAIAQLGVIAISVAGG